MPRFAMTAFVLAFLLLPAHAWAECLVAPDVRTFSEESGWVWLRVTRPNDPKPRASLHRSEGSKERRVWSNVLESNPHGVWIAPNGQWVVTRGIYCNGSSLEHALVVYDGAGKLVRSGRMDELVGPEMMNSLWSKGGHSPETPWTVHLALQFRMDRDRLWVTFPWGHSNTIATLTAR